MMLLKTNAKEIKPDWPGLMPAESGWCRQGDLSHNFLHFCVKRMLDLLMHNQQGEISAFQ